MSVSVSPAFAHRHNLDGTWDSICPTCFFTIATELTEEGLFVQELDHDCELLRKEKRKARTLEKLGCGEWISNYVRPF